MYQYCFKEPVYIKIIDGGIKKWQDQENKHILWRHI